MAKTYNSIPSVATGDVLTATAWNNQATNVNNYRVPPAVRVGRSSDLSYSSGSAIAWNNSTAAWDTESPSDPMWSSGSNTRITIRTAGIYLVSLGVLATHGGTVTIHDIYIKSNTNVYEAMQYQPYSSASGFLALNVTATLSLSAGAWLEGYLDASGGTSLTVKFDPRTFFSATWLGQVS